MGSDTRDYYRALGLSPGADQEAIKRAFRGLVQEHHPDVSDDPRSEMLFRGILEAYKALSGVDGDRLLLESPRPRPRTVESPRTLVVSQVTIDGSRARRGAEVGVFFAFERTCNVCRGEGIDVDAPTESCVTCGGAGWARGVSNSDMGRWIQVDTCPQCAGTGVVSEPCAPCQGEGRRRDRRRLSVMIPAGVQDGQRVRVPGAGHVDAVGNVDDGFLIVHVNRQFSPEVRAVRALAAMGVVGGLVLLGLMVTQAV